MLPSLPALKCVNSKSFHSSMTSSCSLSSVSFVELNAVANIELQNVKLMQLIQNVKRSTQQLHNLSTKQHNVQKQFVLLDNNMYILCINYRKLYQQWFLK
ncbi:Hypothetical_protein [Hexamita inflata]|uniref:Hypothetical_protein n=1 Tax=Hexamita inflata TaxID=28002 RepID=A0AA86U966_9EUKA|nr:Hypothetical protein HINF_LOCUS36000 [Hexamita inflata]